MTPGPIAGTWDFKWPQGSTIRIAFQQTVEAWKFPPIDDLIAAFERHANLWNIGETSLTFEFIKDHLLPAPGSADGTPPTRWFAKSDLTGHKQFEYDVLVSFARLPAVVRPPGSRTTERISAQSSVLGTYALRLGYGIPTMFVGPHEEFCTTPADASDYFLGRPDGIDVLQLVVTHEMGHALGLAHEHQNPNYRRANPPPRFTNLRVAEVLDQVGKTLRSASMSGLRGSDRNSNRNTRPRVATVDGKEIDAELRFNWPDPPGSGFSDWRSYDASMASVPLERQSIMAHPGWAQIIAPAASAPGPFVPMTTAPTENDLLHLQRMYPR